MPNRLNADNKYRKLHSFQKAEIFLAADQTVGTLIKGYDGEFDYFLSTYSEDVVLQKRVPAVLDAEGTEITPATEWRSIMTITDDEDERTDFIGFNRNYEYQFTTATAGSVIHLSDAWFNGGIPEK